MVLVLGIAWNPLAVASDKRRRAASGQARPPAGEPAMAEQPGGPAVIDAADRQAVLQDVAPPREPSLLQYVGEAFPWTTPRSTTRWPSCSS